MGSCSEILYHQTTKMAKTILLLFLLAIVSVMFANGKICWKSCTDDAKLVRNFNIDGCRRRRGEPGRGRPRFRCDGDIGPPCIVKRGDTVYLDVDFGSDVPLTDLKQEAYWVTGWGIHMPWIGLDTEGCGYLKNNCTSGNVSGLQKFSYPIHIMKEYPRGKYNLQWIFNNHKNNTKTQVGCTKFTIKICYVKD